MCLMGFCCHATGTLLKDSGVISSYRVRGGSDSNQGNYLIARPKNLNLDLSFFLFPWTFKLAFSGMLASFNSLAFKPWVLLLAIQFQMLGHKKDHETEIGL